MSAISDDSNSRYDNDMKGIAESRDDGAIVRKFFKCLNDEILKSRATSDASTEKIIVFYLGLVGNWAVSNKSGARQFDDNEKSTINPNCSITTDVATMSKISDGSLKPFSAVLNGKIKISGDRKSFADLMPEIKNSIKIVISESINQTGRFLFTILRSQEGEDEDGNNFTLYVIQITDKSNNTSWEILRRYSDFARLRKILVSLGYSSIPQLPDRIHILPVSSSSTQLIQKRILFLTQFLQLIFQLVGNNEKVLLRFIGFDNIHNRPTHNVINHELEEAIKDANKHASQSIHWDYMNIEKTNILMKQISLLEKRIIDLEFNLSNSFLSNIFTFRTVLRILLAIILITICYISVPIPNDNNHHPTQQPTVSSSSTWNVLYLFLHILRFHLLLLLSLLTWTRIPFLIVFSSYLMYLSSEDISSLFIILYQLIIPTSSAITNYYNNIFYGVIFMLFLFTTIFLSHILSKLKRILFITLIFIIIFITYFNIWIFFKFVSVTQSFKDKTYDFIDTLIAPLVVEQMLYLRSIFIKFGQALASRTDIVPVGWTKVMGCLHDSCPMSSEAHVRETIEEAFGEVSDTINLNGDHMINNPSQNQSNGNINLKKRSLDEIFASFDMEAIASGSIGQVHLATIKNELGEINEVVVKVQHKDIASIMSNDIKISIILCGFASWFDDRWKVSGMMSIYIYMFAHIYV